MGIPDEDSYLRRSYLPSGRATGWRRRALQAFLIVIGPWTVGALIAAGLGH
jgi:hypothetical protein